MTDRQNVLPASLPPRGLSREQAAAYAGVPPFVLDQMIMRETMPPPKVLGEGAFVWDRRELHPIARFADVPERSPSGFIYFITWKAGHFVKVGYATKLTTRLHDLQVAVPWQLKIHAAFPGTKDDEAHVHHILDDHHHRGEWFCFVPEVHQLIDAMRAHEDVLGDYLREICYVP